MDDPALLSWIERGQNIATLLVAIGVAAEFALGFMAGPPRRRVDQAKNAEMVRLTAESHTAGEKAAEGNLRAAVLEKEAAGLRKEAADLTASNLRLEEAIAPRRLTPKQVQELESSTQFSGNTVDIRSYANDAEGFFLGSQLVDALSKAKIGIVDNRFTMQAGTQVFIGVSIDGGDKTLVDKLQAILSESGLTKTTTISRHFSGVSVSTSIGKVGGVATAAEIKVGLKPIK